MKLTVLPALKNVLSTSCALALVAGLSGCSTTTSARIKVDAIQNPAIATGSSYRIVPRDRVVATDPQFGQAVTMVKSLLEKRGMYEATDPTRAEVAVEIDFGVSPRRLKIVTAVDPTFGPTEREAPIAIVPVAMADGQTKLAAVPAGRLAADGTFDGHTVVRGTFVYEKFLSIAARETALGAGGDHAPSEAWRVRVTLEDERDEIDTALPMLARAAAGHLGTETEKQLAVKIPKNAGVLALANADR